MYNVQGWGSIKELFRVIQCPCPPSVSHFYTMPSPHMSHNFDYSRSYRTANGWQKDVKKKKKRDPNMSNDLSYRSNTAHHLCILFRCFSVTFTDSFTSSTSTLRWLKLSLFQPSIQTKTANSFFLPYWASPKWTSVYSRCKMSARWPLSLTWIYADSGNYKLRLLSLQRSSMWMTHIVFK